MYGYVRTNTEALTDDEKKRIKQVYCGLCRTLGKRYGQLSRYLLSYDLTFAALLLSGLNEPEEETQTAHCPSHVFRKYTCVSSSVIDYAADMSVMIAYFKAKDNRSDTKNPLWSGITGALEAPYQKVKSRYPEKCGRIEKAVARNNELEKSGDGGIDASANCTGEILAAIYDYEESFFSPLLQSFGRALGRFIYIMDAFDDIKKDEKTGNYNPLREISGNADFEETVYRLLEQEMAICSAAFEKLPIIQDASIIRNVLYSGVWSRFLQKSKFRPDETNGKE